MEILASGKLRNKSNEEFDPYMERQVGMQHWQRHTSRRQNREVLQQTMAKWEFKEETSPISLPSAAVEQKKRRLDVEASDVGLKIVNWLCTVEVILDCDHVIPARLYSFVLAAGLGPSPSASSLSGGIKP